MQSRQMRFKRKTGHIVILGRCPHGLFWGKATCSLLLELSCWKDISGTKWNPGQELWERRCLWGSGFTASDCYIRCDYSHRWGSSKSWTYSLFDIANPAYAEHCPLSQIAVVTSGAIILLVNLELALEGVLKVGHMACLIFCWNPKLSWILSRKPDRGKKCLFFSPEK